MSSTVKLANYIKVLESHIPKYEVTNSKVSKATIGWQIDYSLKVINNVCLATQNSDPETFKNNMSFLGKLLLFLGKFPRGKAKAPKHVRPPEIIIKEDLVSQVTDAKQNIETISKLPKNAYFAYPMFGHVNTTRVVRFLEVHTKHHLKIIEDMLK